MYVVIVLPYTKAREMVRLGDLDYPAAVPEDVALLTEIRDLLASRGAAPTQ